IISMLITLCSPAQKLSRYSGTPGSVFSQHNGRNWVSFRSAATRSFLTLLDHLRARHASKARDFNFLQAKESPLLVGLEVFHMGMA
ncbi:hypothetical protein, partial [Pseudomonas sp. CAH-1]|uniref:hypothetical protein n=1 Tax=Pseudomonas sp. CAH-1 TaxID=2605744 RepID=UPI001EECE7E2